jgi:glutamate--cysteine ligase
LYEIAQQRAVALAEGGHRDCLNGRRVGLEKESLRTAPRGSIAQSAHPESLGSPLTHPYITTDYSEALVELITPPAPDPASALAFLGDVHRFVYSHLGEEMLWAASMPCVLEGEDGVPIARYGSSNAGMMKTVYRRGLGHRYGKVMQVIAGVHFNYSFSAAFWEALREVEGDRRALGEYTSDRYFGLLRNLQRVGWLIPYLFGASPAVCKSFLKGTATDLEEFDADTLYSPHATSLRMGDIGYQNNRENEIGVKACYDSLEEYVDTLTFAIETPYPGYEKIGVKVDGEYRQLNPNILQIENEYYSTVRPKQLLEGNEKPSLALKRRGVRYMELRSLDINVFDPLGVNLEQLRFLEALTLFCLLDESPRICPWERAEIDKNEMAAAHLGRKPGLELIRNGEKIAMTEWAREICRAMAPVCELLDGEDPARPYSAALENQRLAVEEPDRTPSARMLREMRERGESFFAFAYRKSREHQAALSASPLDARTQRLFTEEARRSIERQREIEAADDRSFDQYLQEYFAQE